MKKYILICVLLISCLSFFACNDNTTTNVEEKPHEHILALIDDAVVDGHVLKKHYLCDCLVRFAFEDKREVIIEELKVHVYPSDFIVKPDHSGSYKPCSIKDCQAVEAELDYYEYGNGCENSDNGMHKLVYEEEFTDNHIHCLAHYKCQKCVALFTPELNPTTRNEILTDDRANDWTPNA